MNNTTTAVAAGAITSPVWLPWLNTASEVAAVLTPILGGIWLLVQITTTLIRFARKDRDK